MAILPLGNVVLLLHCDDGSTSTTLADATRYAQTAKCYGTCSPSAAQSMFGGGSVKTGNGNGNFFAVGTNQTMDFGTDDFTIEGFVYPVSQGGDGGAIVGRWDGTNNDFLLARNADGSMGVYLNGSLILTTSAGDLPLNTWTHIALARSAGTVYAYIGGTGKASAAFTAAVNCTHGVPLYFGQGNQSGGATWLEAYYDEIRISNGVAQYTGDFTPPAAPFGAAPTDPNFSQVALLLHFEGANGSTTLSDSSRNNVTVTPIAAAAITTANRKFGASSGTFDGSSGLGIPGAALPFGSQDWTWECWSYCTAVGSGNCFMRGDDGGADHAQEQGLVIRWGSGSYVVTVSGTIVINDSSNFGMLKQGQWQHIAVVRQGTSVKWYVDGQLAVSGTYSGSIPAPVQYKIGMDAYNVSSGNGFHGQMDDVRVTIGTARYLTTFTPPASAFPDSTGGSAVDPLFGNVKALLHLDGPNGSTTFTDVTGNAWAAEGSPAISTGQFKFGGASLHLDGSSLLRSPPSTGFAFGASDFTVETWVRGSSSQVSNYPDIAYSNPATNFGANAWELSLDHAVSPGACVLWCGNFSTSTPLLKGTTSLKDDAWHHVAITRQGNTFRMFIDGLLQASTTFSGAFNGTTAVSMGLGGAPGYTSNCMTGYVDDFRVTNGSARYVDNFTPPTTPHPDSQGSVPVDAHFANVALLLHGDGADNGTVFIDSSSYGHALSVGGSPKTSTTAPKFGSASIAFSGTGTGNDQPGAAVDYLDLAADTSTAVGSDDFTVETWVKLNAIPPQYGAIFDCRPPSTNGLYMALFVQSNGALLFYVNGGNALSTGQTLSTGVWTHVAVVRRGGVTTIYIGGVAAGTYNDSNNYVNNRMRIGGSGYGNYLGLNGNLDEFRFTPGVARYSGNFTPPSAAFPDYSSGDPYANNVSLLLHGDGANGSQVFIDSSSYGHSVVATGNCVISNTNPKFGTGCILSQGAWADHLQVQNGPEFDLAAGNFTLEGWMLVTGIGYSGGSLINRWGTGPSTNPDWIVYISQSRNLGFYVNGSAVIPETSSTYMPDDGKYHHVAVTRQGSTVRLFLDGVIIATATFTGTIQNSVSQPIRTHIWNDFTNSRLDGRLDEIRVTKGVARYVANFTPATAPFPDPTPAPVVKKVTKLVGVPQRIFKQIRALAPTGTKRLFRVHRMTDYYDGGTGSISGKVTVDDNPDSRKVRLYDLRSGRLLRTTWSAADGTYRFTGLDPAREYFVVGHDFTRTYNAVIQDMVKPV